MTAAEALAELYRMGCYAVTEGYGKNRLTEGYVRVHTLVQAIGTQLGTEIPADVCCLCDKPLSSGHDPECWDRD